MSICILQDGVIKHLKLLRTSYLYKKMEMEKGVCFSCGNKDLILKDTPEKYQRIVETVLADTPLNIKKLHSILSGLKPCPVCYHKILLLGRYHKDVKSKKNQQQKQDERCSLCGKRDFIFEISESNNFADIADDFPNLSNTNDNKVCAQCCFYLDGLKKMKKSLFSKYPQLRNATKKYGVTRKQYKPIEISSDTESESLKGSNLQEIKSFKTLKKNKLPKKKEEVITDPKLINKVLYVKLVKNNSGNSVINGRKSLDESISKTDTSRESSEDRKNAKKKFFRIKLGKEKRKKTKPKPASSKINLKKSLIVNIERMLLLENLLRGPQNGEGSANNEEIESEESFMDSLRMEIDSPEHNKSLNEQQSEDEDRSVFRKKICKSDESEKDDVSDELSGRKRVLDNDSDSEKEYQSISSKDSAKMRKKSKCFVSDVAERDDNCGNSSEKTPEPDQGSDSNEDSKAISSKDCAKNRRKSICIISDETIKDDDKVSSEKTPESDQDSDEESKAISPKDRAKNRKKSISLISDDTEKDDRVSSEKTPEPDQDSDEESKAISSVDRAKIRRKSICVISDDAKTDDDRVSSDKTAEPVNDSDRDEESQAISSTCFVSDDDASTVKNDDDVTIKENKPDTTDDEDTEQKEEADIAELEANLDQELVDQGPTEDEGTAEAGEEMSKSQQDEVEDIASDTTEEILDDKDRRNIEKLLEVATSEEGTEPEDAVEEHIESVSQIENEAIGSKRKRRDSVDENSTEKKKLKVMFDV